MFILKIDEIPDEGLDLKWTEERISLLSYLKNLSRIDFDFETPLQSEVKVWKVDQSILMRGRVATHLRLQCVRCLKEFSYPLSSTFELTLLPLKGETFEEEEEVELDQEDMEAGYIEGGEVHLSEIACEQLFLEIPYQPLCHEGCKGLCPICGINLNLSTCECAREQFHSGFSGLGKLKFDA